MNLLEIVTNLIANENAPELSDGDLEAAKAQFAIDPDLARGLLSEKIDAIDHKLKQLDAEAEILQQNTARFQAKKKAVLNSRLRLEQYVLWVMEQSEFEKLPGDSWVATVRKNNPSVVVDREANHADSALFPEFVKVDVSYAWDKDALKRALQNGSQLFKFAHLKQGKRVEFSPRSK